jgi:hypothetical protein
MNLNPLLIIIAYVFAIPGFYYVYKLRSADRGKSVWKLGFAICVVSQLISGFIPLPVIVPTYDILYSYWMFRYLVPLYVMIGYVIVPLLTKNIQRVVDDYNRVNGKTSRLRTIMKIYLPVWILILSLLLSPVILISQSYAYDIGDVNYIIFTLFYYGNIYSFDGGFVMVKSTSISFMLSYFPLNLITGGLCFFNILFAIRTIQYYHGNHSQFDVLKYGLVGIIWPILIWYALEYFLAPVSVSSAAIPIPILFIIGLVVLKTGSEVHQVCRRIANQIWLDEKTDLTIPEESQEIIEVPIWYSALSRFRKSKRTWTPCEEGGSPFIEDQQPDEIKVPLWYSIISRFRKKKNESSDIDRTWSKIQSE